MYKLVSESQHMPLWSFLNYIVKCIKFYYTKVIKSRVNEPGRIWSTYSNNYGILNRKIYKNFPSYDVALKDLFLRNTDSMIILSISVKSSAEIGDVSHFSLCKNNFGGLLKSQFNLNKY